MVCSLCGGYEPFLLQQVREKGSFSLHFFLDRRLRKYFLVEEGGCKDCCSGTEGCQDGMGYALAIQCYNANAYPIRKSPWNIGRKNPSSRVRDLEEDVIVMSDNEEVEALPSSDTGGMGGLTWQAD